MAQGKHIEAAKKLILEKFEISRTGDYFQLLGVTREATDDEVRTAYFELAKLVHPDRVKTAGLAEVAEQAKTVFMAVSQAFEAISDANRRKAYLSRLESGPSPEQKRQRSAEEEASIFFHRGALCLKRRDFKQAHDFFAKAVELDPKQGRYHRNLGWTTFHDGSLPHKKRLDDARACYEKALSLDLGDAETHYFVAILYKETGDLDACEESLRKATEFKPGFVDAQRELRLLAMRRRKQVAAANPLAPLVRFLKNLGKKNKKK
jgi:DnaJ-class molecular chaperone